MEFMSNIKEHSQMAPTGAYKLVVRILLSMGFTENKENTIIHKKKKLFEWSRKEDGFHFFLGKHLSTHVAAAEHDGTLSFITTLDEWEKWRELNIPELASVKRARIAAPVQAQASVEAGSARRAPLMRAQTKEEDPNLTEPDSPLDNGADEGQAGREDGSFGKSYDTDSDHEGPAGGEGAGVEQAPVLVDAGLPPIAVAQPVQVVDVIVIVDDDDDV